MRRLPRVLVSGFPAATTRWAARLGSLRIAQRRTGSGASAYFPYRPSNLPIATRTGNTNRCTGAGIPAIPNSLR